ncbi:MAG TPA: ABATE domain-containing protein [Ktedonobacteraceae bacterium]|nr:ABATE domain-containing protein [Ktedonobacteraceae bacterium]
MSEQDPGTFDFSGGILCLDFTNTLSNRLDEAPKERLNTYVDLIAWSLQASILDEEEARQLRIEAEEEPIEASRWLHYIRQARESIYQILAAVANNQAPEAEQMQQFNRMLSEAMAHACLRPGAREFHWTWTNELGRLERPLWPVIRSATDLLTSSELVNTRICASEDCGWLFLDTSKNHSRRWCDMKSCGNRAKARRHYKRKAEEN